MDGGWREDDFTKCTEKCSGTQTFNKYCDNPKPLHQGKDCLCTGGSEEISCNGSFAIIQKLCHDEACPGMLINQTSLSGRDKVSISSSCLTKCSIRETAHSTSNQIRIQFSRFKIKGVERF